MLKGKPIPAAADSSDDSTPEDSGSSSSSESELDDEELQVARFQRQVIDCTQLWIELAEICSGQRFYCRASLRAASINAASVLDVSMTEEAWGNSTS